MTTTSEPELSQAVFPEMGINFFHPDNFIPDSVSGCVMLIDFDSDSNNPGAIYHVEKHSKDSEQSIKVWAREVFLKMFSPPMDNQQINFIKTESYNKNTILKIDITNKPEGHPEHDTVYQMISLNNKDVIVFRWENLDSMADKEEEVSIMDGMIKSVKLIKQHA